MHTCNFISYKRPHNTCTYIIAYIRAIAKKERLDDIFKERRRSKNSTKTLVLCRLMHFLELSHNFLILFRYSQHSSNLFLYIYTQIYVYIIYIHIYIFIWNTINKLIVYIHLDKKYIYFPKKMRIYHQ